MLTHYHAQVWKGSELARSLGASEPTMREYLDILSSTFMVRQLAPWHENLSKRQVKSPKVYLRARLAQAGIGGKGHSPR